MGLPSCGNGMIGGNAPGAMGNPVLGSISGMLPIEEFGSSPGGNEAGIPLGKFIGCC